MMVEWAILGKRRMPISARPGWLVMLTALLTGCAVETIRDDVTGRQCIDATWPLAIPIGAGPPPMRSAGAYYPLRPCAAHADCPPGAYCQPHGPDDPSAPAPARFCRTRALPVVEGSLAEAHGVPSFELEVVPQDAGHRLRFSGLPPLADFALCSFYSCPVDAPILAEDVSRCLLETVSVDLRAADGLLLPPATDASRAERVSKTACGTGEPLRVTPAGYAAMCVAYKPSGVAAVSTITPLRPEQIGAIAGDTFQLDCTDATLGSACAYPRGGAEQLGICVGDYCCTRCASSVPTGTLLEQACASVSGLTLDVQDPRFVQLGYAEYGVCFDGAGRAVCLVDGFIPDDAPGASCRPRAEPRADDPSPRAYDEDGDGVSIDLDCDDRDPERGRITVEATSDGIDQDCDGRVDEVTVRPCVGDADMVSAWAGGPCIDRYEASRPDATAATSGRVVGPARSRPGVMPWVGVTLPVAREACRAAGKDLCPPEVFRQNCLHASGSAFPYGPDYDAHACNGADGLFGVLMPTGTLSGCAGQSGAVDLVGNASEWTDGGQVAGGSYVAGTADLSCQSTVRYEAADAPDEARFAAPWLGFRCCRIDADDGSEGEQGMR